MANLLLAPDNWANEFHQPAPWDGSKYSVHSPDDYTATSFTIRTIDGLEIPSGSTLAGTVSGGKSPSQSGDMYLTAWWFSYSSDPVVRIGSAKLGDDPVDFSFQVPDGPGGDYVIKLTVSVAADDYWGSSYYGQWVEVVPAEQAPLCSFNCTCDDPIPRARWPSCAQR
jgi:hypothetical protein